MYIYRYSNVYLQVRNYVWCIDVLSMFKEGFWLCLYKVIVVVDLCCNILVILNLIVNVVGMVCKIRKRNYQKNYIYFESDMRCNFNFLQ